MRWIEISVQAEGEAVEAIAEVFNRLGEGGAVIETLIHQDDSPYAGDPVVSVKTYLPANPVPSIKSGHRLRAVEAGEGAPRQRQIEEALWHLSQLYPIPAPHIRELAEEDWAEAWKKGYSVQHIGRRVVVVPSWEPYTARDDEIVLRLDPGMAFGTGLHPTTQLCLLALEAWVRAGDRVLDVGTGSGILAIAAAKLGATQVIGVDLDPVAVQVARDNVRLNEVADRVEVEEGSLEPLDLVPHSQDRIVVNILADVIIELTPALVTCLDRAGTLIVSGILEGYADSVVEAFESAGLHVMERWQDKDWVALIATPEI
ncbi:MAG: 50S ribosomal protein L11 methyltransferase [Anaerolineae bacterium]